MAKTAKTNLTTRTPIDPEFISIHKTRMKITGPSDMLAKIEEHFRETGQLK